MAMSKLDLCKKVDKLAGGGGMGWSYRNLRSINCLGTALSSRPPEPFTCATIPMETVTLFGGFHCAEVLGRDSRKMHHA